MSDAVPAPLFTLVDPDGNALELASYSGKLVLLSFLATWCPPCLQSVPGFIELYKTFHAKGLEIIGIALDKHPGKVRSLAALERIPYPIVMGDADVLRRYGNVNILPTTLLLNRDLRICKQKIGYAAPEFFAAEIRAILAREEEERLLAEKQAARAASETLGIFVDGETEDLAEPAPEMLPASALLFEMGRSLHLNLLIVLEDAQEELPRTASGACTLAQFDRTVTDAGLEQQTWGSVKVVAAPERLKRALEQDPKLATEKEEDDDEAAGLRFELAEVDAQRVVSLIAAETGRSLFFLAPKTRLALLLKDIAWTKFIVILARILELQIRQTSTDIQLVE